MKHAALTLCALALLVSAPVQASPPAGGDGHGGASAPASGSDTQRRRMLTSSEGYVPLSPLTASVHADFRMRGVMQIEAGLEIPDHHLRQRAERLMPRLRDAYVATLGRYAAGNYRYGDVPDADRISTLLQQATDDILGQDGADFLLGMIIINEN